MDLGLLMWTSLTQSEAAQSVSESSLGDSSGRLGPRQTSNWGVCTSEGRGPQPRKVSLMKAIPAASHACSSILQIHLWQSQPDGPS